ncbi:uncharacterized protein LOC130986164 isoform X4 [Salvia miltiorrhiza]|uniref:uncharacterized protein LOC130986164 isoform X4 n=1 Tax=Salvia miltiorrhiza TaxID=226208 RepID=UPI0025ACD4A8|nr:uncharacterized protein LOC130986164 isoform X4 [Salvia miltiorrhiza]
MGCSGVPTAVFTETNLGTCLAVPASPDITADDFKREVERAHLNCFPEFGTIRVKAVMVITYRGLCLSKSLRHNGAEVCNLNSAADVITNLVELGSASPEKRTKCKRKIKVGRFLKISTALCFRRKWKRKNAKKSLKRDTQY